MADMQALERLKQKYKSQGMSDADAQAQAERDTADLPGPLSSLSKSVASEIYSATPKAPTAAPKSEPGIPAEASANKARPEELDSLAAKLKAKQAQPQEQAPPPPSSAAPAAPAGPKPTEAKAGTGMAFDGKDAAQFRSKIAAMMESTDDKEVKAKASELDKAHADLMAQYKKDKTALDWGRVGEMLGRALTQLAAGAWGAKNNVDLSNLKGEKWDWKQDFDNLLEQTKMESSDIEKRRNINEKEREALDRRKERQQGLKAGAEETIYKEAASNKREIAKEGRTAGREEAADRRKSIELQGKSYDALAGQLSQEAEKIRAQEKTNPSYTLEQAQSYARSVGADPNFVQDQFKLFGKNEVSAAQLSSMFSQEAIKTRQKARETYGRLEGGAPATSAPGSGEAMIMVREKTTGRTGKMPASKFDPAKYEKM